MKRMDQDNFKDNFSEHRFKEEEAYLRAKKKLERLVGFYWHLAVYIVVNIFIIVMIAVNSDPDESIWHFGTFATAFFWGIGLFFHFMSIFGPGFLFGKNWEDKKIKEFMKKEEQNRRRFE